MRLLLDNVLIHRVDAVIGGNHSHDPIRSTDAVALLNIAEHIMFADKLFVPSFETSEIWEISQRTLNLLRSIGCIDMGSDRSLIEVSDVTEEAYATACIAGTSRAIEMLSLGLDQLEKCARLADKTAIPSTFDYSLPEKWLDTNWPTKRREELRSQSLAERSKGAVDFMVTSSNALYERIRQIARETRSISRRRRVAPMIQIACFVALNEQLAKPHGAVYAPAPQRARVVHQADVLFRQSLARLIKQAIVHGGYKLQAEPLLMTEGDKEDLLPIPMFAIHFLRAERITNPIDLLIAARRLRDAPDVKRIRSWLVAWEKAFADPDLRKRQRAQHKLQALRRDLQGELQGDALYSVFRPTVGVDATQTWSLDPDIPGAVDVVRRLWRRIFSPEAILLSELSREFSLDHDIGSDIIRMLGRALVRESRR